ncbi:restriction endonuclease subunit S [Helicobacter pylori]|uniref:restriction endonuclease subunit S n=1 Tax=Helicobacter pylori TaxID=210 RepID=UPI000FDF3DE2|nr:restriction endonuclease subunit S [Helicobacter pylori]RVY28642.1 restriction endonuclease subunit S [Helicobacter pylori]RVZ16568.1 restriction endonuclease subunit S [Helicobacter pylori]
MDALTTPSNWQRVRLGDIAEINPPTIIPNVFYYIDLESVEKGQLLNKQLMTKNKAPSRARRLLSKNDILYQLVRPYQRNNYFFTLNGNYVASTGYAQIRTLQNPSFLYFALHSNYFVNAVLDRCEGTSYPAISSNELKKCEVILPPLNEQIAIANILSDVDRYLYSLDALILKKEGVKKALSFELLSQRKRLKGFNQAWQKVRLGTYKYRRGSFPQPYGNPQWYSDNGMPFVQVYDVGENFKLTQKTKQKISKIAQPMSVFVPKNSVIITLQGTIGRVALTQYDCYCDRTILIFDNNTLNDVNKYFFVLSLFTKFEEEKRKADGSIIKTITKQTLKDFEILLPPLNEQIAIANILSALDSEIISLKNKKRQFENIKKALNHDLMSAKIRVLKK